MGYLEKIHCREDLNALSWEQTVQLCRKSGSFLIEHVSQTGGHLATNLGVVELTVAIHKVFDTSQDRLVFDVGHQSYVHKMLTGRCDQFSTLRSFGGMAGFPKPSESEHDAFIAGPCLRSRVSRNRHGQGGETAGTALQYHCPPGRWRADQVGWRLKAFLMLAAAGSPSL